MFRKPIRKVIERTFPNESDRESFYVDVLDAIRNAMNQHIQDRCRVDANEEAQRANNEIREAMKKGKKKGTKRSRLIRFEDEFY